MVVRHRRLVGLAATLAILLSLSSPVPTLAADNANCNSGTQYFFSGMWVTGQKHGSSGTIDGQDLHMCTSPGAFEESGTFAWSAVGNWNYSETIVQIGIGKCRDEFNFGCGESMRYLWAWGRNPSAPGCSGKSLRLPVPSSLSGYDGVAHDYKVYHKNNAWRVYVGVTEKTSVSESEICWTPNVAEWFSETWDAGDALGGSVGNKLVTNSTNYANAENGGFFWTSFGGPYPNESCSFEPGGVRKCQITGGQKFQTWTDR
jgi:hypothetical protein